MVGLLFLLAINALAWGPETNNYICEESVIDLWGADAAVECLTDISLSSQLEIFKSDPMLRDHIPEDIINPALIPDLMFNDTENHHDYSNCPIIAGKDYKYLCANSSENPTRDNAQLWFSKAINSTTLCERIQKLCIAANYFANSYFPPNRIEKKSANDCEKALSESVDKSIVDREESWHVRDVCRYEYNRRLVGQNKTFKYKQAFALTNDGIDRIVSDLVQRAQSIKDEPLLTTTTTSIPTTTKVATSTVRVETTIPVEKKKSGTGVFSLVVVLITFVAGYLLIKKRHYFI